MRKAAHLVFAAGLLAGCAGGKAADKGTAPELDGQAAPSTPQLLVYPAARRSDQVDVLHGVEVADPYRWLEDPDSDETRAWVEAENALTFAWLEQAPARAHIRARLTELWNFEKVGVPFKEGGRYFFTDNPGLLNQSQLLTMDRLDAEPRLLLDPNTLSADGTVALHGMAVSRDGRYLAYALSSAGSDWQEWKVRDVDSGQDLADHLRWSKFSAASWSHDNQGFYYSAYDPPAEEAATFTGANYFQKLYFHRLGTPQAEDRLVYQRKDHKEWGFEGTVSEDGRYLVIQVWQGTDPKNGVFYLDLKQKRAKVVELLSGFDAHYVFVGNQGQTMWFHTDQKAPRGRLVAIDLKKPQPNKWVELVPEGAETLEAMHFLGGAFVGEYLQDAKSVLKVFDLMGTEQRTIELPGIGSAGSFAGHGDDSETFFAYSSFTTPTTIFRHDIKSGETSVFRAPKLAFDPEAYETKQVFYNSLDGTTVPMFISHKKGLNIDSKRPTYLYGYGGFNISLPPYFSVSNLVWMEMGGVFALPNIRGGNEYGEEWHQGGVKLNKQNVFDDFIAAAEWLQSNGYTDHDHLAIGGGSNGGLLIGACMTQRPELFAAALPAVGVMDMLRYHTWTIGWAWASDYGTAEDPAQFKALYAYSPYHNIKPGTHYPATLITTADHDDRVVPAHSFKFAAALQHAQAGPAPTLIRIETRAGHGAGKPTTKIIDEAADRWAFAARVLGLEPQR